MNIISNNELIARLKFIYPNNTSAGLVWLNFKRTPDVEDLYYHIKEHYWELGFASKIYTATEIWDITQHQLKRKTK